MFNPNSTRAAKVLSRLFIGGALLGFSPSLRSDFRVLAGYLYTGGLATGGRTRAFGLRLLVKEV